MSKDTYTVKSEHAHECGQIIGTITYLVTDATFLAVKAEPQPVLSIDTTHRFSIPMPSYKPKMELTGYCERVEVTGIEMKDNRLLCLKCGSDVLLPDDIEPTPKHDGKLDKDGSFTVYYDDVWSDAHDDAIQGIHVLHRYSGYGHVTFLPQQALSLLVWLRENEATLEKLAKEQAG